MLPFETTGDLIVNLDLKLDFEEAFHSTIACGQFSKWSRRFLEFYEKVDLLYDLLPQISWFLSLRHKIYVLYEKRVSVLKKLIENVFEIHILHRILILDLYFSQIQSILIHVDFRCKTQ